jgi:hypothetical protein
MSMDSFKNDSKSFPVAVILSSSCVQLETVCVCVYFSGVL